MNYLKIAKRMLALFLVTALSTVGVGAAIGIDVLQAALLAGIMGIANVVEDLARGYLNDGQLTDDEIDMAFVDNIPAEKK
jgi:hypothetical protein